MSVYLYVLIAVLFWGGAPIFEKVALRSLSASEGVMLRSLVLAVVMSAFVGISGDYEGLRVLNWRVLGLIAAGGLCAGGLGQMAYFQALKMGSASMVVPMAASYPLVAMLLSIGLLGESLTLARALGAVMIVAGVALVRTG